MSVRIEVVYALPQTQERISLDLASDSTVRDALQASGLLQRLPQIALSHVGVWGKSVGLEARLRDRDRVEIYRRLLADPKEIRRARAAKTCK